VLAIARDGRESDVREAISRVATLLPFGVDREGVQLERPAQMARA
jgi:hypothetical protein